MTGSPASRPSEPIVGIDLGTTNSLVAYCDEAGPRILTGDDGEPLMPSIVRIDPDTGRVVSIGQPARLEAIEHPQHTLWSIKRLMGRSMADVADDLPHLPFEVIDGENQTARVRVGSHVFSPPQVSAMLLGALRRRAEAALGQSIRKAVITVPAYFDDAQRQATRDAGRIAGLDVVRILNEPTAAALAYGVGLKAGHADEPGRDASSTVAVFDLGGGTFDLSILRLEHTEHGLVDQVLATAGDTHLGGDDVDQTVVTMLLEQLGTNQHAPPPPRSIQMLRDAAERAKRQLSDADGAAVTLDLPDLGRIETTITRDALEARLTGWVDRAVHCCDTAMAAAGLEPADIDRVILVGGATRMPLIRRRVAEWFEQEPYTALNPDEVVALGAAVQASVLMGVHRDTLLLDVIPLSLGIETMGGAVAKLIMANTTIPARAIEQFSTFVDGQTKVAIHVVQGERELAADCRSLGRFELRGIPPMPAGLPKIEVTFLVDANGILNVTAIEKRSETVAGIQVVPTHGLTREEVERMELESFEHAAEDMTRHRLIDLRNQARMDLRQIEHQLTRVGSLLDVAEQQRIVRHMQTVRRFVDAEDADPQAFHEALHAMDHATIRLAELAVRQALQAGDAQQQ